jgi:ribosomal protein S14
MSSKYLNLRNLRKPIAFLKKELIHRLVKVTYLDFNNSIEYSISFRLYLLNRVRNSYKTQIRRACVLTGRTTSVDSNFSFSRFVLKSRVVTGGLTGFKKSSW